MNPFVRFESHRPDISPHAFEFEDLEETVEAHRPGEVLDAMRRVDRAVESGLHAAGYVTYEAASGFDDVLTTHPLLDQPLLWFGLFRSRRAASSAPFRSANAGSVLDWVPSISRPDYVTGFRRIQDYIRAGDTYQVNHTYSLAAAFNGDPERLYRQLCAAQRVPYAAHVFTGHDHILSASPELFFERSGRRVVTRPMKGTRPRGRWSDEDGRLADDLRTSEKERAENVMIVDLLRNDLGRIARTGTVHVPSLWEVEAYDTVFQLTSTVAAELDGHAGLADIFCALFPCGSVTGAPKRRTMEIIAEVEAGPRGVYTGAIGFASPGGLACFNVAIRTIRLDMRKSRAEFGVGGGIVADSRVDDEYEETRTKAVFLSGRPPAGDLLETLAWRPGSGYELLEHHLERMAWSADRFGFRFSTGQAEARLLAEADAWAEPQRVRLTCARDGTLDVASQLLGAPSAWAVSVSDRPVSSRDPMLYHKTTDRTRYRERTRHDCDDVILVNERGELTECGNGNLVLIVDGRKLTPPLDAGLLPGTFRRRLIEDGKIVEHRLLPADLDRADAVYLINSVRGWVPLRIVP